MLLKHQSHRIRTWNLAGNWLLHNGFPFCCSCENLSLFDLVISFRKTVICMFLETCWRLSVQISISFPKYPKASHNYQKSLSCHLPSGQALQVQIHYFPSSGHSEWMKRKRNQERNQRLVFSVLSVISCCQKSAEKHNSNLEHTNS